MNKRRTPGQIFFLLLWALLQGIAASAQPAPEDRALPTGKVPVHDPVLIREGDTWYLLATGQGIAVWSSKDRKEWKKEKPVFGAPPEWAVKAVPGFRGHIWAPDIRRHNGLFYLYYSVSAFGRNTSCIGVAVNRTLDPGSPEFKWEDKGLVVQSVPGRDLWNAIDPQVTSDEAGRQWMVFGSFWSGLKLVRLSADGLSLAEPAEWHTIARRPRPYDVPDSAAGPGAVEAPFLFQHNGYYYLFASADYCCQGERSNYKIIIGRSRSITGPYLDREGRRLDAGGGTVLLQGDAAWHGLGHNAVVRNGQQDLLVFHAYDAADKGRPKLRIENLDWTPDGWPLVR
ncbi:MAG TPA: arabinan endo-1,5-alpha-L-arabinosidase [Chitinophagaceae bacterium]|jgi:arabinan endo-1,5-alpha-L-arabinosidase|nr:arabinan endo-1,5-alpha-L-arabinosidase [Chitinophagaceae bacterium]